MTDENDDESTVARVDSGQSSVPAPDQVCEKIGRYRVTGILGQGGFGRVYRANDDDLNRPVAIKVPNPQRISHAEDVELFLIEARILAKLDHPNIVPVYDVGRTEDGHFFIVSKFLEGSDLAAKIRQAHLGFVESSELIATVAEALHYAHTQGLVHRDIKPANILIDASGKPCVADFGLALRDEDFGKGGAWAGTPSYMSPEQARGEGHLVDGRSDVFSLGVVYYVLLTGRNPFRGGSHHEIFEQVIKAEARPPRQIDDKIPKELERICLRALSKRASERYTTAWDMADDLRGFLKSVASMPPVVATPLVVGPPAGSTPDMTPIPSTSKQSDSDQRPVKIIPKGLRSFDEHDADFFLELLPGPRDRDGLPESLRFWRSRIEATDPDKTFRVGLIYGPSGCGKSSLVKAGLLPVLRKHVVPVYIEATPKETEARVLKSLRRTCPDLSTRPGLVDSLIAIRQGRALQPGHKVLLVLDQFEQWLHAKRREENTELVAALRQCDGEHLQAVVMVRDDFWMAATRFMDEVEIELLKGQNAAAVDLFDPRHARKVLTSFGTAYGNLPELTKDVSREQHAFLDRAIAGLSQDGKVISVRLALFAEMVKGKPWTPAALRAAGDTEGVGVTFLEETFGSSQANPKHRLHQRAAQAVLKALLPETGTDIKGQMRSEADLQKAAGYDDRPREFADLIRIVDTELRLITPTEPEDPGDGRTSAPAAGCYYQLTHDYLVHSLRDWLTRKQRETRRGRAELRLAERSALWNTKPENRHLPSLPEWARIRLLTKWRDWTEPQRKMMKRARRVHTVRGLSILAILSAAIVTGFAIRREVVNNQKATRSAGLVKAVLDADTPQVPGIVAAMREYRHWVDPALRTELARSSEDSPQKLHASLALLPVDNSQVEYLFSRLLKADPAPLTVLRDALKPHQSILTPKLWSAMESAKPGDASLLPAAGALASYDTDDPRWAAQSGKVAQALVTVNSLLLGPWTKVLRPVHAKLTLPLVAIFRKSSPSEIVHSMATDILTDYAGDNPGQLAELLMVSDPKAYRSLFPTAEKQTQQVIPVLRAELAKKAKYSWDDLPLNPSWTKPNEAVTNRIEWAEGTLAERFAFCQTMPLHEFLTTAEALRESGYRPVRYRPYSDGQGVRVAAVWTRDGRRWRLDSGLTVNAVRQQDERNKKDKFLPVDVAGYVAIDKGGKAADLYAALWVEKSSSDDARLYAGMTDDEETTLTDQVKQGGLLPRTQLAFIGPDGRASYCSISGTRAEAKKPGENFDDQLAYRGQFEDDFEQRQASLSDKLLVDIAVSGASKPQPARERNLAALETAEAKVKAKPKDAESRLARAVANFALGENQKAVDDLLIVIATDSKRLSARWHRAIALARLGKRQEALSELPKLQSDNSAPRFKLSAAAVVAAELGTGTEGAFHDLETAIQKRPEYSKLRYDAVVAFSLASKAISRSDKAKSRELTIRCLQLLREAVKNHDADFSTMAEDADLDPIRDDPEFAQIVLQARHPERRYAAAWSNDSRFEARSIYGLGPAAQIRECRDLIADGYRPVSLSANQIMIDGPPVTASVWHRPTISEETRDRLAERQARAAIALVRMGKAEEVWPILRHSVDPRVRSFIVNWLNPLGADPKLIAAELSRLDTPPTPQAPLASRVMDAVLFQPETSERRALIIALGTYGMEGLSAGDREPLIAKLIDLYRNDPDSGIHGAVEWTLRQWKHQDKLVELVAELMRVKDWGRRRWFVNGQGQTFAKIEGPVEFRMGSPPTEPRRFAFLETPRRVQVTRRFAIAATEVTVEQFQHFLKHTGMISSRRYQLVIQVLRDRFSPDPDGPWLTCDWYGAAHYCNWLSEQEGLPKDQWCYLFNKEGAYAEGMSMAPDILERTGYRLPTGAEWEYACRASAITSRYYGHSIDLLDNYGRHMANSAGHAWACGRLISNDLGLFDMLGNAREWCLGNHTNPIIGKGGISKDVIDIPEVIVDRELLQARGGDYKYDYKINNNDTSDELRSASRDGSNASMRSFNSGFRPARTYR